MNKLKILSLISIVIFGLLFAKSTFATQDDSENKVTICHRTNSVTNPYTNPTVDFSAADGGLKDNGQGDHTSHTGPVFDFSHPENYPAPHNGDQWGDIIPPYTWDSGSYPGLNWSSEGQAIWNAGCTGTIVTPPGHHFACVSNTCALVDGDGTNSCNKDEDCSSITPTPGGNPGDGGSGGSGGGQPFVCTVGTPGDTTLLSVVRDGVGSVKLTWSAAENATDYIISYGLGSNHNTYGVPHTGNVTSFSVGALDLSKTYCFNVIPVHECRQGNPSNPVCTAFGGAVLGLSNTSSNDNSIMLLVGAVAFVSSGLYLLLKKNA